MRQGYVIDATKREEIGRLYQTGLSSREVARSVGCSGVTVCYWLRRDGLLRSTADAWRLARSSGRFKTNYRRAYAIESDALFDLSPDRAWALGVIYGDGHIGRDRVDVVGTEQVVTDVARICGSSAKARVHSGCYRVSFCSRSLCARLRDVYGLPSDKASCLRFPHLSENLMPHFLRGLWDADGCWFTVNGSLKARYECASKELVSNWFARFGGRMGSRRQILKSGEERCYYNVCFRIAETNRLARNLYADSRPGARCERKFLKVAPFLKGAQ